MASASRTIHVTIPDGAGTNQNSQGYIPASITVVIGVNNSITWTNKDSVIHTVTANDGSFDSKDLRPSQSFSYTFTTPGSYSYHCIFHSWMMGTVVVKS